MFYKLSLQLINNYNNRKFINSNGDWGLGIGDWGLGIGPNPPSPIPNPKSPNPNPHLKLNLKNII